MWYDESVIYQIYPFGYVGFVGVECNSIVSF